MRQSSVPHSTVLARERAREFVNRQLRRAGGTGLLITAVAVGSLWLALCAGVAFAPELMGKRPARPSRPSLPA